MARENLDIYEIGKTPEELQSALIQLRNDFDSHNHDGSSSRAFQSLQANTISSQVMLIRKTSYTDSTSGIWMGIMNNVMKLKLGSATNYLQWDGSALTIIGSITATTGSIGGWTVGATSLVGGDMELSSASSGKIDMYSGAHTAGNIRLSINAYTINFADNSGNFDSIVSRTAITLASASATFNSLTVNGFIHATGSITPTAAGTYDLGDATNYWSEINYKTLTDRGCLGWFDEGVELVDGRKVSDMEAIKSIKKHPTKQTVYGVPMFDYTTMPKAVYKPAPVDEKGNKKGVDGAETTALISIMLGAMKELADRIEKLELSTRK